MRTAVIAATRLAGTPNAVPDGDVDAARRVLHRQRLRVTRPRVRVLAALLDPTTPSHRTVPDLHDTIEAVDLVTVYRIVGTLTERGVLHRLDIRERAAVYGLTDRPHHHAVCHCCGGVTEIAAGDLHRQLDRISQQAMFSLDPAGSVTLHGLCHTCQTPHPAHAPQLRARPESRLQAPRVDSPHG